MKNFEKEAKTGDPEAQLNAGLHYDEIKDYDKAFFWFNKAAIQGNAESQFHVGRYYAVGFSVIENSEKAYEWYLKSAEQGHMRAQGYLGNMYFYGIHVEQDFNEAKNWLTKAVKKGDPDALGHLGRIYELGYDDIKPDLDLALEFYQIAAESGSIISQQFLAELFFKGNGIDKNYSEAAKWFKKPAEEGFSTSQFHLGVMYAEGLHFERDLKKAAYWINLARKDGHELAEQAWNLDKYKFFKYEVYLKTYKPS